MLVSKIQTTNLLPRTVQNNSKAITQPALAPTIKELTKGIDSKSYVNITFRGEEYYKFFDAAQYNEVEEMREEIAKGIDINIKDEYFGETALMHAARAGGAIDTTRELLSYPNIDVNAKDKAGNTALIHAAHWFRTEQLKELLKHPDIDINAKTRFGESALVVAMEMSGHCAEDMAEELLKYPMFDVNTKQTNGDYWYNTKFYMAEGATPLICACIAGKYKIIRKLLKRPDLDTTIKDEKDKTAFDYLCKRTDVPMDIFVDLEQRTKYQTENPDWCGLIYKRPVVNTDKLSARENIWTENEITKYWISLIKEKTSLDEAIKMLELTPLINLEANDKAALKAAMEKGNPDLVIKACDYMLNKQPQMREEYERVRQEYFDNEFQTLSYNELTKDMLALNTYQGLRRIIDCPEFNPNDSYDCATMFERACLLDPTGNLAREILSKYDDVITKNERNICNNVIRDLIAKYEESGKTELRLKTIEYNMQNPDTVGLAAKQIQEFMDAKDFNPEKTDSVGNTVLHIAATLPDDSAQMLIQKALDKGIDINAGNVTGQRPLMSAIKKLLTTKDENGKRNIMANINFLLNKGADINAQDNNGQTAFHFACLSTFAALLTLLLSKKPNVFLEDKMGKRACKYLRTPEMKEIYQKYIMG